MPDVYMQGTFSGVGVYRLGIRLISQGLKSAAFALTHTGNLPTHYTQSLLFVQGSGLDVAIQLFGTGLNAEQLREGFDSWICASSSPIIGAGS